MAAAVLLLQISQEIRRRACPAGPNVQVALLDLLLHVRIAEFQVVFELIGRHNPYDLAYLPVQHGARLPRNAPMPSCASAARAFIDITSLA